MLNAAGTPESACSAWASGASWRIRASFGPPGPAVACALGVAEGGDGRARVAGGGGSVAAGRCVAIAGCVVADGCSVAGTDPGVAVAGCVGAGSWLWVAARLGACEEPAGAFDDRAAAGLALTVAVSRAAWPGGGSVVAVSYTHLRAHE